MELFKTIQELRHVLDSDRNCGHTIGFVPTMGALHQGHLALVERAGRENDKVVVSIFVNPNQFNDPNDLRNYPRNLETDIALLNTVTCNYVFAPSVDEVYPAPDDRIFDFGELETVMEGRFRPGHFNGVAQVVSRLFDMVTPDRAYFGLKDFQQYSIIKSMVKRLSLPIDIVPCDIVRESDGLAMSSRNALLTREHRDAAPNIYRILREALGESEILSPQQVKDSLISKLDSIELLRIEYFEIVDEITLQPINSWDQPGRKVGCIAVFAGPVRLIDNIVFDK
jgi:pantoate--beta-alanine ligase